MWSEVNSERAVELQEEMAMENNNQSSFILFKTEDEKISVDVRFEGDTVWLTQAQLCVLFQKSKATIREYIKNVFEEGELEAGATLRFLSNFLKKCKTIYILPFTDNLDSRNA